MLSASEAKRKTLNNIESCVINELNQITKQIEEAISNGKFSICNDGILQYTTRERLESFGYKVETGSQYNESYYTVSWY